MVNVRGSLLVAPFGGLDRRGGTSRFWCGIPRPGEPPVILDFATSLVAEGKALVALRGGTPLPEGAIIGSWDLSSTLDWPSFYKV
jgi:Malate/L-lactate dehydrogenases